MHPLHPPAPALRKFPYPYRNMLAILSDVDMMSKTAFENMHRFLNTDADCGALGRGVGLDVGDTFWMGSVTAVDDGRRPSDNDHRSWRYWWTDSKREIFAEDMRRYLAAGWIDVPHTFFDYRKRPVGYSESRATSVVDEWRRIGYAPLVWVDHARNPWNIATYRQGIVAMSAPAGGREVTITSRHTARVSELTTGDTAVIGGQRVGITAVMVDGPDRVTLVLTEPLAAAVDAEMSVSFHPRRKPVEGAVRGSPFRSVDVALSAGIRAFWTGLPPAIEASTCGGRLGLPTTVIPQTLPDGTRAWGLLRYYESGQTNNTWLGACLSRVLFGDALTGGRAMQPDTYMIVSTHLGYGDADLVCDDQYTIAEDVRALNAGQWFNRHTVEALRALAKEQACGRVLVANTTRLVRYNMTHEALTAHAGSRRGFMIDDYNGRERITVHTIDDPLFGPHYPSLDNCRGLTFYCTHPERAELWLGGRRLNGCDLQVNAPDHTGRGSLGICWYPADTTDHTRR